MSNYYGENKCQTVYQSGKSKGKLCDNMAYYYDKNKLLCGLHSDKKTREKLIKNPNAKQNKLKMYEERQKLVDVQAKKNKNLDKKGDIVCTKLRMLKLPLHIDGYLKVFPNFKHQDRKDGFGCSSLSPKSLGPIYHNMFDFPVAKNLENYHQGSKIFYGEIVDDIITSESIDIRKKIYDSTIPYRHKFDNPDAKKIIKNIPLFSVYYDKKAKNIDIII